MSPIRAVSISLALALAAACESPTVVSDGTVSAERRSGEIVIRSAIAEPLGYLVVERSSSAYTEYYICSGPSCPTLPPRGRVSVADSAIHGWTPAAREALVWWWRAIADSTAHVPADSIHSLIVTL